VFRSPVDPPEKNQKTRFNVFDGNNDGQRPATNRRWPGTLAEGRHNSGASTMKALLANE
jgi:hypothetical protein